MKRFNIRVYGILITPQKQVLLTEEHFLGRLLRKFPGGGLRWGEGIIDCLKREWREETQTTIIRFQHFYTTEFFQRSFFNPDDQIISIYYRVWIDDLNRLRSDNPSIVLRFFSFSGFQTRAIDFTD